ncbi:MAG: DUF2905 domain-containing protein [Candidatus Woesearchaeota archaeon]
MVKLPMNKILIFIGAMILVFGLFYDRLTFIGRLPGDIYIQKNSFHFYFPITTMIIISLIFLIFQKIIQ